MIDLSKFTDAYERRARVYPALLCIMPPFLSLSIIYPEMYTNLSGLTAIAVSVGGIQFLAQVARDAGKGIESSLFEAWGGVPSIAILRHRDEMLPSAAKIAYHEKLRGLTKIQGPTLKDEAKNPTAADDCYRSWSDFLRTRSRNSKKFPLVFKENVNYGFRRNLFGLKRWCLTSAVLGAVIALAPCFSSCGPLQAQTIAASASFFYGFLVYVVVNPSWVRVVAYEYAKQLIESLNA